MTDDLNAAWRAWQATEREGSSVEREQAWRHFVALVARAIKGEYIRNQPTLEATNPRKTLKHQVI